MRRIIVLLLVYFHCASSLYAQSLVIDSTRFVTGVRPSTAIRYAFATDDQGIIFVGNDEMNPCGIIPTLSIDTIQQNLLVGKIDSNGQIVWLKVFGGSLNDVGFSGCQTPDGGFAIIGYTESNNGDVTGFKGASDIWLLRLDATGNLLWEKTYGSSEGDLGFSIANTSDSGFVILGATNGSDDDVPFHYGGFFSNDWLVIKTDISGNKQWAKDFGGSAIEQSNGSIISIGKEYFLVSSSNSTDQDCTDTSWHSGIYSSEDYNVLKLDSAGNLLWSKSYGGSNVDDVYHAYFDLRDSSIMIIGTTYSNDYMVSGNHGYGDIWVVKLALDGSMIWQKTLGSGQFEKGTGICPAEGGKYLAYGNTISIGAYDSSISHYGVQNCWLSILDSSGNELSNKIFGGSNYDFPASIVRYKKAYAATGTTSSKFFTEGTSNGNVDTSAMYPDGQDAFVTFFDQQPISIVNVECKIDNRISVFPNPTIDLITVRLPECDEGELEVINTIGQIFYKRKENFQGGLLNISVKGWEKGMYYVIWNSRNGPVLTAKIIKN